MHSTPTDGPPGAREVLLALLAALLLAALPVREGLLRGDRVLLGVDGAAALLPWRAAVPDEARSTAPRNPGLYDQAVVFYPTYRWVARSWLAGDPPLWNPLLYAGAPGVGNPQAGVLDPQVAALVGLEALGGQSLFDRGFALLAWLRLAAAGLGAYLLARVLGLGRAGAALAGVAYGFSGYLVAWLGHPLGHVPPLLPFVLLGLEGTRGVRPRLAAAGAGLALLLTILAGHPETAFYGGVAAGLWALAVWREDRRAGARALAGLALGTLAGAAALLPFVEYLLRSGAREIRRLAAAADGGGVDLLALGVLALGVAIALALRAPLGGVLPKLGAPSGAAGGWTEGRLARSSARVALAASVLGVTLLLRARGLPDMAACAVLPDVFGAPGDGASGYVGAASFPEAVSGFLPAVVLALAVAAALAPRGPLRRRRVAAGIGLVAFALCLSTPGLLDLWHLVPLVGLGDVARFGATSALFLALLAGEALDAAPRGTRIAGALATAALALGLSWGSPPPLPDELPSREADEHVGFALVPPAEAGAGELPVEGWIAPGLPVARAELAVLSLDAGGAAPVERFSFPAVLADSPSAAARATAPGEVARAPDDARWFRVPYVELSRAGSGAYELRLRLFAAGETDPIGERSAGATIVRREAAPGAATLALVIAGLLGAAFVPRKAGWLLVLLALAHALVFARGTNPAVPRAECFPETRTEAVLADLIGDGRFFSDPQVLPPDTGLVRGLRALDGYDGMDVAAYNAYRPFCVPGGNALLGWHARGVALDAPAFRMFGVTALALAEPLEAPGFALVSEPPESECWIYRAEDPLPRAFLVPHVVSEAELEALDLAAWDPRAVAAIDGDWRPAAPFAQGQVEDLELAGNNEVRVRAQLDGDGLLVVTEQHFPGWSAEVDGVPAPLVRANGIFRGVPLSAGEHEVVLRYAPGSLKLGLLVSGGALLALLALAALGLRRGQGKPAPASA